MAYIAPRQKYEDLRSSASALLWVGIGIASLSLLSWFRILPLPMQGASGVMFKTVMTLMGLASIIGGIIQYRLADKVKATLQTEENQMEAIISWFSSQYTAEQMDSLIMRAFPEISEDEKNLKRFEYIHDCLVTGQDLPDQSYVDALTEEIYQRLYE